MKTQLITFIFLLIGLLNITAQTTIKGRVVSDNNSPLEGASVYLNSTSIGTTTNSEGYFELVLQDGVYDLIVSFIGFETMQYNIDSKTFSKPFLFKLKNKTNLLDEVFISNKKLLPEDRAYFMQRFKSSFIGETNLSKSCEIINEKAINFKFDLDTKTLSAYANEPIEIKHKGLGYVLYFDLVDFQLTPEKLLFLGYTRYENLEGSKRKDKMWKQNRTVAYNGSSMHFLRSIIDGNVKDEGFIVDNFKRVPNPERPTDSVIQATKAFMKTLTGNSSPTSFVIKSEKDLNIKSNRIEALNKIKVASKNNANLKFPTDDFIEKLKEKPAIVSMDAKGTYTAELKSESNPKIDSCLSIISKSRLNKFIDVTIKKDLQLDEYSSKNDNTYALNFDNYLKITYNNEPEEYNYRPGNTRLEHQVSIIMMYVKSSLIDKTGVLVTPLDMFLEGYWSYEKVADNLPLNYKPHK